MKQLLEEVVYGNPTREQIEQLQKPTQFDYLLPSMFEVTCPSNISTLTQDELRAIVDYQKQYNYLPESVKKRYQAYDDDIGRAIVNFIYNKHQIDITEMVKQIFIDTLPIILKLKYKFQRPRPFQLGYYYKQSIFPVQTLTAISPSFPSGHVFHVALVAETLGNVYPKTYQDMSKLLSDVIEQRLFYGLHYPSDCDRAVDFAKTIVRSKEWIAKYNI